MDIVPKTVLFLSFPPSLPPLSCFLDRSQRERGVLQEWVTLILYKCAGLDMREEANAGGVKSSIDCFPLGPVSGANREFLN